MVMKAWPSDGSTVAFGDLVNPIREAIEFAYDLTEKPLTDIPYDGYDIGDSLKAGCIPPDEKLKAEMLAWVREDQYRDTLDEILEIAVQLGIEQGRRTVRQELGEWALRSLYRERERQGSAGNRVSYNVQGAIDAIERIR